MNKVNAFHSAIRISSVVKGSPIGIGSGFTAHTFREAAFDQHMDPLALVDHYVMTEPTFGPHPHAGLSAVSVLFEDSEGKFHNRDSLGNDFDILPGDLYWLKAGSGAVHDEAPRAGARIHGLQVFVNLPAQYKQDAPVSKHVSAHTMPVIEKEGVRVRVVLGESNQIVGATSPALPMTILDGYLSGNGIFKHDINAGENAWLYAIESDITVETPQGTITLKAGDAVALSNLNHDGVLSIALSCAAFTVPSSITSSKAHFALFSAKPIKEAFVQKGPFIMSNEQEIKQAERNYAAGLFGRLD
ncbi:pirin family protein [Marinomonas agarivorans]|nr:pirin family protein [Marinomonas agarivorans]